MKSRQQLVKRKDYIIYHIMVVSRSQRRTAFLYFFVAGYDDAKIFFFACCLQWFFTHCSIFFSTHIVPMCMCNMVSEPVVFLRWSVSRYFGATWCGYLLYIYIYKVPFYFEPQLGGGKGAMFSVLKTKAKTSLSLTHSNVLVLQSKDSVFI